MWSYFEIKAERFSTLSILCSIDRSEISNIQIVSGLASFTFHGKRYSVVELPIKYHSQTDAECQTRGAKLAEINYIQEMHG